MCSVSSAPQMAVAEAEQIVEEDADEMAAPLNGGAVNELLDVGQEDNMQGQVSAGPDPTSWE